MRRRGVDPDSSFRLPGERATVPESDVIVTTRPAEAAGRGWDGGPGPRCRSGGRCSHARTPRRTGFISRAVQGHRAVQPRHPRTGGPGTTPRVADRDRWAPVAVPKGRMILDLRIADSWLRVTRR